MTTPDWYTLLLLGLAAWSLFHLVAHDDILDRPRRWVLRLGSAWEKEGDPIPDEYRVKWGRFLTCPYCMGFYVWIVWLAAWWIKPEWVLPAAVLIGGRGLVVAGQKVLGKAEDQSHETADALRELAREVRYRK